MSVNSNFKFVFPHYYATQFSHMQCYNLIGMDDPETILRPLANHLRPTIMASWMEKKKALFTENAILANA